MWLDIYKQGTIKQGSYRQLKNLEALIPDDLKQMEIGEILPLHLQRFIRDFATSASKSYMDKMRVLLRACLRTQRITASVIGTLAPSCAFPKSVKNNVRHLRRQKSG